MRKVFVKALFSIGLVGGLMAAGGLAYFIWSLDWGTGRRSGLIGTICLVFLPPLLWAIVFFSFGWLATLIDDES